MRAGRWYPTQLTLGNGNILTMNGTDINAKDNTQPEIWDFSANHWVELTTANKSRPMYPRIFQAPDGRVFYAGEAKYSWWMDPSGTGSWTLVGDSLRCNCVRDYGSAVMYDQGKILYVGGGGYATTGSLPEASAEIIDISQTAPRWKLTGSMQYRRRQMNATLLADGQVLATGGTSSPGFNDGTLAVLTPELWNSGTGAWSPMAAMAVPRLYHSEALLMLDGRVLSVGSGQPAATNSVDEFNAELYSPPYLFNPDGTPATYSRPTITSAPTRITYGQQFAVGTPSPATVAAVNLIRLGTVTHAFNGDQRLLRPTFSVQGNGVTVTAPTNGNLAPPGYYMLYLLNSQGTPSVSAVMRLSQ
jgi:hypothetical protein